MGPCVMTTVFIKSHRGYFLNEYSDHSVDTHRYRGGYQKWTLEAAGGDDTGNDQSRQVVWIKSPRGRFLNEYSDRRNDAHEHRGGYQEVDIGEEQNC